MKTYMFGAGKYGIALYNRLSEMGIVVDGFVTSNCEDGYMSPNDIEKNDTVLIAIGNKYERRIIKNNLIFQGVPIERIIDCGDFIYKNNIAEENIGYCIMCGNYVNEWKASGRKFKIYKDKHIIGGGVREKCICPECSSKDRERWVYYVLRNYTSIFSSKCNVLHFAPERELMNRIIENNNCRYLSADIEVKKKWIMHKVDITSIQFADESFDFIIANHVIEHVKNEKKALSEVNRVLKKGGCAILSFPICLNQRTIEERDTLSAEERIETFGQEDHVRLYGFDYRERIENMSKLRVASYSPQDVLEENEIDKYGFIKDDIVLVCTKPK